MLAARWLQQLSQELDGNAEDGKRIVPVHALAWSGEFRDWAWMTAGAIHSFRSRASCIKQIESAWQSPTHSPVISISVRTALDLWLQVMHFPEGSEVLASAVNIPDMQKVFECHGLRIVPVELDMETMAMDLEDARSKLTPKTRMILVAHIFARNNDISQVAELARENDLYLIEDAAECYRGLEWKGSDQADVTLFSFGQIKLETCMSGGIAMLRDERISKLMIQNQELYPAQSAKTYLWKSFFALVLLICQTRFLAYILVRICQLGFDYRPMVTGKLRGFPSQGDFLQKFRFKPGSALLNAFAYRFTTYNREQLEKEERMPLCYLQEMLKYGVRSPGALCDNPGTWLCPQFAPNRLDADLTVKLYIRHGIEACVSTCQLKVLAPTEEDRPGAPKTEEAFKKLIFMPVTRCSTLRDVEYVGRVTRMIYERFNVD